MLAARTGNLQEKESSKGLRVGDTVFLVVIGVFLLIGAFLIGASLQHKQSISTNNHHVQVNVEQKVVNGLIVSTDTIYVFTEKK